MIMKVNKDKIDDEQINDYNESKNYHDFYPKSTPPKIPKSDLTELKKPPINLRIHNTKVIEEKIEIKNIVGLAFEQNLLDDKFRPKSKFNNKKYRKVWKWIHGNPLPDDTFVSKSITLAKIGANEYYVIEGIRRVSALKQSKFKFLKSQIIDYTEIYNKILERKNRVKKLKSQSNKQIIKANTTFKPKKLSMKPTPIKKL